VQHVVATSMQLVSHTRCSKCPPLALMHAVNRLVKLRMEDGQWDPAASHFRSTEELILTQKYMSDVASTSGKDQA